MLELQKMEWRHNARGRQTNTEATDQKWKRNKQNRDIKGQNPQNKNIYKIKIKETEAEWHEEATNTRRKQKQMKKVNKPRQKED